MSACILWAGALGRNLTDHIFQGEPNTLVNMLRSPMAHFQGKWSWGGRGEIPYKILPPTCPVGWTLAVEISISASFRVGPRPIHNPLLPLSIYESIRMLVGSDYGRGASRVSGSVYSYFEYQREATTGLLLAERLVGRPVQTRRDTEN